jgi:hypothetical protein
MRTSVMGLGAICGTASLGQPDGSVAYSGTARRLERRTYPRCSAAPVSSALAGLGAS